MLDPVGQLLAGRFEVVEAIGRGGHSIVYRAFDRATNVDVAVKLLNESAAGSDEHAVRLVREHQVMTSLAGTAAIRGLALTSTHDGAMCLVMELLRGVDFDDYLGELDKGGRQLQVPRLVEIIDPIVTTLAIAHDRGIIHRDLKPANIYVLEHNAGVRLLDFGLAKIRSAPPLTKDGMILGSPSYIAPEVWAGRPRELDHRVDIYSLGAIVFRALGGEVPFPGSSIKKKIELSTTAPRPSLHALRPDLPEDVDVWVGQVLAIEPEMRFSKIRGMWNAFKATVGYDVWDDAAVPSAS